MLFTANRKELLKLARQASVAVPSTKAIEEIAGIHLASDEKGSEVTLTATNFEMSVQASLMTEVQKGGSIIIDHRLFTAILAKLPEDNVLMEIGKSGNTVYIQSGSASYDIVVRQGDRYPLPDLPFPTETVSAKGLSSLVKRTAFAASTDKSNTNHLQCIKLNVTKSGLAATACNGFQLVRTQGDETCVGEMSLLVPAKTLQTFAAIADNASVFDFGKAGGSVTFWDGSLLFSARLMEGAYLDTDNILSMMKTVRSVSIDAAALSDGLSKITGIGGRGRMKMMLHNDSISLENADMDYTVAPKNKLLGFRMVAEVPAEVSAPSDTPYYLDADRLLSGVSRLSGKVTMDFTGNGETLLRDEKTTYMQVALPAPRARAAA